MCGIQGSFHIDALPSHCQAHRGRDNTTTTHTSNASLTHHLHAVNGHVKQPFTTQSTVFLTNCEIYNADELAGGRNDAESLHNYLDDHHVTNNALTNVDGVYALAHYDTATKELRLARDLIGVKPIWYYHGDDGFAFASEKKTLLQADLAVENIQELHPRHILSYDATTNQVSTTHRAFDLLTPDEDQDDVEEATQTAVQNLENAVTKRIPDDEDVAVLFSGGVDSALLAHLLNDHDTGVHAYYAGIPGEDSRGRAKQVADDLNVPLTVVDIDVDNRLEDVADIIDDAHYVKLSVALAFDAAAEQASEDGYKVIMSGTGVEELYGGYHRQQSTNDVNDECRSGLRRKYFTDLYRDDTVTMNHGLELRTPYLDHDLIKHAMAIPHDVKQVTSKRVIRRAAKHLGVPHHVAEQPKSATQYGSGTANELKRLAADNDEHVGDYIQRRCTPPDTRVATLLSTGKDSCLATQRMIDYNYNVDSFLTVKPEQENSYMSHAANIDVAKKQASAANKSLLTETSAAQKESELDDYQRLIHRAKRERGVEGVVTGAVASEYQRQRIEQICDRVGVKPYAPLWHTPGESVIKQVLKRGFHVIIEKTAAAGFDDSWVEKHIEPHVLEELRELKDEYGVHVAGEGGEFETLVLDAPFFTQRLVINDSDVVSDGRVHRLRINDVSLQAKDE